MPQPIAYTGTHKRHFHLLTTLSWFTSSLYSPWWSSSIHLSPLWIPSVGVLGSQVMLTFSCLFSSIGESVNRMEGGLVVFLLGCQLSPYTWTLWIFGIPRDPMGDESPLPDLMNSAFRGKILEVPLNNTLPHKGWVAIACTLFSWPQLANTNIHVHTHKHKPSPLPDFWRDLVV